MENRPDVGISGCKLIKGDGKLDLACRRRFPNPWNSFKRLFLFNNAKIIIIRTSTKTKYGSGQRGRRVFAYPEIGYIGESENRWLDFDFLMKTSLCMAKTWICAGAVRKPGIKFGIIQKHSPPITKASPAKKRRLLCLKLFMTQCGFFIKSITAKNIRSF